MNNSVQNLLKNKKAKIMVVDQEFANEIDNLSKKMGTSSKDVVAAAIELLKLAMGREVILRKPNSDSEINLPFFKKLDSEVDIKGEDE